MATRDRQATPAPNMVVGLVLGSVGAFLLFTGLDDKPQNLVLALVGLVVGLVGSTLWSVGIIAAGVRMGMRGD